MAAIWAAAWSQAQVVTLARLETVTAERDAAQALAATRAQDVAGLSAEIYARDAAAQEHEAAHATELVAQATAAAETLKSEVATLRAEFERTTAASKQAADIAARDVTIERQHAQAILDRQIEKYTELKAMVSHLMPKKSP